MKSIFTYDPPNWSLQPPIQDKSGGLVMFKCPQEVKSQPVKSADFGNFQHAFGHFLTTCRHQNITTPFMSWRGGYKLQFGGPYMWKSEKNCLQVQMHACICTFTDDCLSPHPISAKGSPPSCPQILCIMHYSFAYWKMIGCPPPPPPTHTIPKSKFHPITI